MSLKDVIECYGLWNDNAMQSLGVSVEILILCWVDEIGAAN